jgi:hypothetical protein
VFDAALERGGLALALDLYLNDVNLAYIRDVEELLVERAAELTPSGRIRTAWLGSLVHNDGPHPDLRTLADLLASHATPTHNFRGAIGEARFPVLFDDNHGRGAFGFVASVVARPSDTRPAESLHVCASLYVEEGIADWGDGLRAALRPALRLVERKAKQLGVALPTVPVVLAMRPAHPVERDDTSYQLAAAVAVLSLYFDLPVPPRTYFTAGVSSSGELGHVYFGPGKARAVGLYEPQFPHIHTARGMADVVRPEIYAFYDHDAVKLHESVGLDTVIERLEWPITSCGLPMASSVRSLSSAGIDSTPESTPDSAPVMMTPASLTRPAAPTLGGSPAGSSELIDPPSVSSGTQDSRAPLSVRGELARVIRDGFTLLIVIVILALVALVAWFDAAEPPSFAIARITSDTPLEALSYEAPCSGAEVEVGEWPATGTNGAGHDGVDRLWGIAVSEVPNEWTPYGYFISRTTATRFDGLDRIAHALGGHVEVRVHGCLVRLWGTERLSDRPLLVGIFANAHPASVFDAWRPITQAEVMSDGVVQLDTRRGIRPRLYAFHVGRVAMASAVGSPQAIAITYAQDDDGFQYAVRLTDADAAPHGAHFVFEALVAGPEVHEAAQRVLSAPASECEELLDDARRSICSQARDQIARDLAEACQSAPCE